MLQQHVNKIQMTKKLSVRSPNLKQRKRPHAQQIESASNTLVQIVSTQTNFQLGKSLDLSYIYNGLRYHDVKPPVGHAILSDKNPTLQ
jgi:hypothetical protein